MRNGVGDTFIWCLQTRGRGHESTGLFAIQDLHHPMARGASSWQLSCLLVIRRPNELMSP